VPIERRSTTPIRFGPFEVDSVSGELRKHGVRVKLQQQPLQILEFLLEHPGDVVTREELRQRLWPADTFVDFDHGLYNAIKRLREALGDVADTPRFIETVPKRGYKFIGEVAANRQVAANEDTGAVRLSEAPSSPALLQPRTASRKKRLLVLVGAGSLALVLFLLVGFNVGRAGAHVRAALTKASPQIHSLAVLPLKNLSDDPDEEYFSYGITEELITDLAQISGLKVISHTSVLQYAKSTKPLPQIAGELGVDGIVEGTVQRSGDRVRITAQLIYAPQEQHLWAATYNRDLRDALTLQSSVAAAIVEPIRSKTAASATLVRKPLGSSSLQAMEDYLQGNYSIHRMATGDGHKGYEAAIRYFKKAISEDPDFAPAYVALANAYDANYDWRPDDVMPLEKVALMRALELDPGLADAHLRKAFINEGYDCNPSGAESEIKEALRLNPNLAHAHAFYSGYLQNVGRTEESIAEAKRAQELDPQGSGQLAILIVNHQYDQVIEFQRRHLELHPNDGFAYIDAQGLIDAYHFAGRYRESAEALQQAWTLFGFKSIGQGVGNAYAATGYAGALRYSARQMEHLYAEGKVWKPDMIASWYARAGDEEQALKWIGITLADNNHCGFGLERDPDFASYHSDRRFQELVKQSAAH
jgi:TolB-like protein/DNA-binding winged helix-turn-helix (wHTH) protein/Tfp pilus assembly protein PilF